MPALVTTCLYNIITASLNSTFSSFSSTYLNVYPISKCQTSPLSHPNLTSLYTNGSDHPFYQINPYFIFQYPLLCDSVVPPSKDARYRP